MGPNFLFMCIMALMYHLSVQFLDIDVQEISGKHPENSGNLLSRTGVYFQEISLSERLWSGERTTGHGNFQRIFFAVYILPRFVSTVLPTYHEEVVHAIREVVDHNPVKVVGVAKET